MVKITTKSQIENRQPEQMQYSITNAHYYSVCPNCTKPDVGRWPSQLIRRFNL